MEWTGEGIVLGARRHGEGNVILETMTRERGRHLGMVRGGAGPRLRPMLQAGNTVKLTWRARLDEHLGSFAVETITSRSAALMGSAAALHGVALVTSHLRLLAERDPHPALFDTVPIVLDALTEPRLAGALLVRFEVAVLEELGFGLDLTECAATGCRDDLIYVSPKSGRAVSAAAGEPYRGKLFALPAFLREDRAAAEVTRDDVLAGLRLTGFFLERHVYGPRGIPEPDCRGSLVGLAAREALDEPAPSLAPAAP